VFGASEQWQVPDHPPAAPRLAQIPPASPLPIPKNSPVTTIVLLASRIRGLGIPALAAIMGLVALVVMLVVALVARQWTTSGPTTTFAAVPEVGVVGAYVGQALPVARADALSHDWKLVVTVEHRDGTAPGDIVDQDPVSGERLEAGSVLRIVRSLGPEPRDVPAVIGMTPAEAAAVLAAAGFTVGTIGEQPGGDVAVGSVSGVRFDGEPVGDQVASGAVLDLMVAAPSSRSPMPSFVGLTLEAALDQAEELGLVANQDEAFNELYDAGFIVDTMPPTGGLVGRGDRVTLVVSAGPEQ
jgi:serine/threonine-protein kinase